MEEEIWKDIQGYEGEYQVSTFGNVRSLDRISEYVDGRVYTYDGKLLKKRYSSKLGYEIVTISKNSKIKHLYVHRLVAEAFIDNPMNYKFINHKDENKRNNHISNLEWCTPKYNMVYSDIFKKSRKKVIQYTRNNDYICTFDSIAEAEKATGIQNQNISKCCKGKRKTAGGYKWRYDNEINESSWIA